MASSSRLAASKCAAALQRGVRLGSCRSIVTATGRGATSTSKQADLHLSTLSLQAKPPLFSSRAFSTSEVRDELVDLLNRELDEEKDNDTLTLPTELAEIKDTLSKEWKIVDDGALTQMYKTTTTGSSALKIQLSFHCQDIVEIEGDEEFTDETSAPVRFTTTVTKAGQSLVLTCLSEDAQVRIQSVAISGKPADELQRQGGVGTSEYQGPEFTELAEDLQDSFYAFLEDEIGLDTNLATFVAMYTDYKEQTQYVDFLEKAKKILSL